MSINETCKLIAETRKIIEGGHDGPANITDLLNLILQVVTNIDTSVNRMEKNMDSRINELHQSMLSVSSRVRSLETQTTELNKKLLECETSCQGVGNLFDEVEEQTKSNTRNIIHHDSRIKKLETFEKQPAQNQDQHIDEINRLKDSILDLQCRSMKNNLIFTGISYSKFENCEQKLRNFLYEELEIEYPVGFGNVHRFGKKGRNGARPIVARFIYRREFEDVLRNAFKLRGKPVSIHEQFPAEIENRRKQLYPVMKQAKRDGKMATMTRDKLFIDGERYMPINEMVNHPPQTQDRAGKHSVENRANTGYRDAIMTPPNNNQNSGKRPYKRQRAGSSPGNSSA